MNSNRHNVYLVVYLNFQTFWVIISNPGVIPSVIFVCKWYLLVFYPLNLCRFVLYVCSNLEIIIKNDILRGHAGV